MKKVFLRVFCCHFFQLLFSQTHFSPRLAARAKMSLSRAQNIFMPANINSIVILTLAGFRGSCPHSPRFKRITVYCSSYFKTPSVEITRVWSPNSLKQNARALSLSFRQIDIQTGYTTNTLLCMPIFIRGKWVHLLNSKYWKMRIKSEVAKHNSTTIWGDKTAIKSFLLVEDEFSHHSANTSLQTHPFFSENDLRS